MTASTAGTPPATDLTAVADQLSRAADRIKKLASSADTGGWRQDSDPETVWPGSAGSRIETCNQANAAFIAAFDPHTVAALIPMLRRTAKVVELMVEDGSPLWEYQKDQIVFARRLLGEEENSDA